MSGQERAKSGSIFGSITLDDGSGAATWWSCTKDSLRCSAGEIIVLRVAGEVDLCTLPNLQFALDGGLCTRPSQLVVDLTRMTFCSIRGFALLTHIGRIAAEQQTGYAVSGVPPHLDRVWGLGWGRGRPVRYGSIAAAVAAIRAAADFRSARARP